MQTVPSDPAYERRLSRLLLDVLIRAGLILVLVMLCYRIFSPFLVLMVWALILAITLYPLHQALATRMGGRQGWAATLITAARRRADRRAHGRAAEFDGRLGTSPDRGSTAEHAADSAAQRRVSPNGRWSGRRSSAYWQLAHDNPPALVKSLQPKIGELAKVALAMVASIGGGILAFVAAFIIAGIIMAFGEAGDRRQPGDLRARRRRRTRRRVHHAVGGDDPRRRPGRDRHRLHPGHSCRPEPCSSPACRWPACWRSWCSCLASRRCRR